MRRTIACPLSRQALCADGSTAGRGDTRVENSA